jgi:hypothetical protein
MSYQKKIIYSFNNFYLAFLMDIKKYNDEFRKHVKTHFKVFDKASPSYFETIKKQFEKVEEEKADIQSVDIIPDMSVSIILDQVEENEKNTVLSYLYIFQVIVAISNFEDDTILEKVLDIIKTIQENEEVDEKLKEVLDDDISNILLKLKTVLYCPKDKSDNPFSMLENSKIGSLAKEISNEINIGDLNISSPEQLLDFSNFTSSNNVLGNIISKVSDKIQNKISNGEISQTDLVNEALSFVGMMGSTGGKGGSANNPLGDIGSLLNNPMISELIGGLKKDGNTRVQVDQSKVKNMETRERLRKKLEKKRQSKQ